MKKLISAALCGIMLAAALVGCGGSSSQKTYNLDDVVAAVEKVNEGANPLAMDDFAIENDVGLNLDDVAEYKGEQSNNQGDSATILVVKANSGKAADVQKALEAYKIVSLGYGQHHPVASFKTEKDRSMNRRVEFMISKTGGSVESLDDYYSQIFGDTTKSAETTDTKRLINKLIELR